MDVREVVVEVERGARGGGRPQRAVQRLRAVVPAAHRHALLVQEEGQILPRRDGRDIHGEITSRGFKRGEGEGREKEREGSKVIKFVEFPTTN